MELLTVQEAASRAGVSAKAIYYHINHGQFTRHSQFGKVLVDAEEVAVYRPRASSAASPGALRGFGLLSELPGSSRTFMKRKAAEKALES
jgi:hypothetical protein